MSVWINASDPTTGKGNTVNLEQVVRIEFEAGDNSAILAIGPGRINGDSKGITWFEVTDQEQVRALRQYVNRNILKDDRNNPTRFV